MLFFQTLTNGMDFAGIVSVLAVASGILSTYAASRLKSVEVRQLGNVETAKLRQSETQLVLDNYKEFIKELRDEAKENKMHALICEKQLDYLKTKLLKAGVLEASDLETLMKLETALLNK